MTYSIVAFDGETTQWGVAVASKAMCVGAHVPWGAGGVGAVATQAYHDLRYGFEGLRALHNGRIADEVVHELTDDDPESVFRQLGVVDASGRAATFTGARCTSWAGGLSGDSWAVQGNILSGPHVVEAMAEAYIGSSGPFAERLLTTLLAGDQSGGDRRGRQSAAVKIWHAAHRAATVTDATSPSSCASTTPYFLCTTSIGSSAESSPTPPC